jgi:hypothetical protein
MKKFFHWFHAWQYRSGGSQDIGRGYGLRYRTCTECGKTQRLNDFSVEYEDIEGIKDGCM